jgi:hypothetical protein
MKESASTTIIITTMKMKTELRLATAGAAAIVALLLSGCAADGSDANAVVGGAIGGGLGAAIGQEIGGSQGAVVGGAIGGATGAAAGSNHNATRNDSGRGDDEDRGYRRRHRSDDDDRRDDDRRDDDRRDDDRRGGDRGRD